MAEQASLGFVKRQSRCIILTKGEKNGETSIAYHFISFLYLVPHQNSSSLWVPKKIGVGISLNPRNTLGFWISLLVILSVLIILIVLIIFYFLAEGE